MQSTTTMQRRSTSSHSDPHPPVNGSSNGPEMKQRRRRKAATLPHQNHHVIEYGTKSEALLQMILLGTLLFILIVYTLYRAMGTPTLPLILREPLYSPASSMSTVGDKSREYSKLRQEYDDNHPDDPMRSRAAVIDEKKRDYTPIKNDMYDVFNCPMDPPTGYPYAWNILQVLEHWPPDETTQRPQLYQGLCVFDYLRDYDKAKHYRNQELPFIIQGDPVVHQSVERWNAPGYLDKLMGPTPHRTEYSPNNHFMYWVPPRSNIRRPPAMKTAAMNKIRKQHHMINVERPDNWTQPTEMLRIPYAEWLSHANVSDDKLGPDQPHWYYRLIGCGEMNHGDCDKDSSEYLFDELPFFQPKPHSLYIKEPAKQRGIHCRFGMTGVIAENHFDASRNFILVLKGERRYILAHPNQCPNLALYPMEHPSARHSAIDWSDPDLDAFPQFANAEVNEVVLQAGDVLYLPTNWFHYIISLELNMQCNTRSGTSPETMHIMRECGFE